MSDVDSQFVEHIESIWRSGSSADREDLIYGIARYVSKLGGLSISDRELRAMQVFFRIEDAVELYERIRDASLRFEGEWRDEFINYFPMARGSLPRQQMTEEEYDQWMRANGADI